MDIKISKLYYYYVVMIQIKKLYFQVLKLYLNDLDYQIFIINNWLILSHNITSGCVFVQINFETETHWNYIYEPQCIQEFRDILPTSPPTFDPTDSPPHNPTVTPTHKSNYHINE